MTWLNFPEEPEKYIGFIYIIENIPEGKYYIGKKQLLKKTRLKANKTRKRDKVVWKDNDVEKYWGSSKELLADIERLGVENFTRKVIEPCTSKFHMSYAELKWQLAFDVLLDPKSYNGIINVRLGRVPKGYIDMVRDPDTIRKNES
jgi:hypothetical protein